MSEVRAAHRYARAILEFALEAKQLDVLGSDFDALARLMDESRDLVLFLKSPVIKKEKKKSVLSELFSGRVSVTTYQLIRLLAAKDREDLLPEIIRQFRLLRDARDGILDVTVRSAVPLAREQEQLLLDQLRRVTGKQPRIRTVTDPSLIGGFAIQYEDTVWDGSVRHQLARMRRQFAEGHI
jgi:F-type H+-transporting ATPase subunit delta